MNPTKPELFIKNFKRLHPKQMEETFLYGDCYWFSDILEKEFGGEKYYLEVENHFICKIKCKYYDIRGLLTLKQLGEVPIKWSKFCEKEPYLSQKILKWCKDLEE